MASKKLISAIAKVQKQGVRIQQMNLNASLRKNGLAGAKRNAENHDKYKAGGQVKKTRLWKLDLETRQGALFLVADLCDDPAFLEMCRKRAQAEETGVAWSAVDGRLACVGSPATTPPAPQSTTLKPTPNPTSATGRVPAMSSPAQQMTVRFRGPIPPGHRLNALGLRYNRVLEQWDGEAVREAVEQEISGFRHLLLSIEIAASGGVGQTTPGGTYGGVVAGSDAAKGGWEPLDFVVELES